MDEQSKITYHQQVSYCGKERCRKCRDGIGHGPYWYAYQLVKGRTVRTYIGKNPPTDMNRPPKVAQNGANPIVPATLMRFYTLGQFRLEQPSYQEDEVVWEQVTEPTLQHQRVRSLLTCLACTPGRKLGREQVMYMLWPDLDVETAAARLDRAVHNLRQIFEPGRSRSTASTLLVSDHTSLVMAEQARLWIDADAFERLLTLARATNDLGEKEQLLEEATKLYGGDFLPAEVPVEGVLSRRESLRRSWITIMLELSDLRMAREALAGAVELLDRLLGADLTNEAAAQRLMALLAQMGRRSEAVAVYQRLAASLHKEFKITPLAETRTLFDAVLSGDEVPRPRTQLYQVSMQAELSPLSSRPINPEHMHIGRTHQSPLVGREEEMERLHNVLHITEQTRKLKLTGQKKPTVFAPLSMDTARHAQFQILMGDVGLGKTRLAEEISREAKRRNWAVAWCRAYSQEGHIPYRMWIEILRKAMAQGLWQRQELTNRPLLYQPLGTMMPEFQDILPGVLYAPPVPPEQEQLRLWEATRALLSMICEQTTIMIVLDDVQWADYSSCEMLAYLVRQLRGAPIMFLCTCREIDLAEDHPLRGLMTVMTREQAVEVLPLKPLKHEQIRELISYLPPEVIEPVSRRASGNPFFAEELARGAAVGDLQPALESTSRLPDTIMAVLEMRLTRITPKCLHILERAAVLGDAFLFNVICAMASGGAPVDEEEVLDLLEEGLQAGMLLEDGQGANVTFTFWHPLLQAYLYEHLSAARRASFHRRAAQVLQEHYAGRESEGAAEITRHLIGGGGPPAQIAYFAELAADRAYRLSTYLSAEKHYRITLEYLGELAPDAEQPTNLHYAYLYEQLGECTMIVGKFEDARAFYERTVELRSSHLHFDTQAERAYEAQLEALLWCEISRAWRYLGDSAQARAGVKQSEQVLRAAGIEGGPAWARIRYQQGHTCWLEGSLDEALTLGQEALQRFQSSQPLPLLNGINNFTPTQAQRILNGDSIGQGRVYTLLAGIEATLGRNAEALAHLNQALEVFEKNEVKSEITIVSCNLADMYLRSAEYAQARQMLTRSYKLADEIGHAPSMSVALVNLGVLATRQGDLAKAEDWYGQALALIKPMGELFYTSLYHSYLATALIEQGKLDEAQPLLMQALKISRSKRIAPCTGFALVALGQLRFARAQAAHLSLHDVAPEELDEAQAKVEKLLRRARATLRLALTFEGLEADVRLDGQLLLARVAFLLDEAEQANEMATRALEEASASELVWLQARGHALLALVQHDQEGFNAAQPSFERALHIFERTGMRLEHARVLYARANLLLDHKASARRREAAEDIGHAREVFQACQAALDLQSAELLLKERVSSEAHAQSRRSSRTPKPAPAN